MDSRASGTFQCGHLRPGAAQQVQSYSVRTAGISAGHLCAVRAETHHREQLERYGGIGEGPVCWVVPGKCVDLKDGYLEQQEAQGWRFGTEYTHLT